eukprot:TRINITY_DN12598_c0_g1_i1.p2 TRINITY_DN12598_c0_g1~~TRINITY_DN12598_c0_g1_i1.p2  ORF type:complete len:100 (-),score=5.98 TRINITY_DN12598_c0_g1_i1:1188-1487(-)
MASTASPTPRIIDSGVTKHVKGMCSHFLSHIPSNHKSFRAVDLLELWIKNLLSSLIPCHCLLFSPCTSQFLHTLVSNGNKQSHITVPLCSFPLIVFFES